MPNSLFHFCLTVVSLHCLTTLLPAQISSPPAPRDPLITKILENWYAAANRGPREIRLKHYRYSTDFHEVRLANVHLHARGPSEWRYESQPNPGSERIHKARGEEYSQQPGVAELWLRTPEEIWFVDVAHRSGWNFKINPDSEKGNPPQPRKLFATRGASWFWIKFPDYPPWSEPGVLVLFPWRYQPTIDACDIEWGSMHESGDPIGVNHLVFHFQEVHGAEDGQRMEILFDPESHLPLAVRFVHSPGMVDVYCVISDKPDPSPSEPLLEVLGTRELIARSHLSTYQPDPPRKKKSGW